jgi:hypothetical protein
MDRVEELKRIKRRQSFRRWKDRKAGLLPPLAVCPRCDRRMYTDRWAPYCSRCATALGWKKQGRGTPRRVRLLGEAVLAELLTEARGQ